MTKIKTFQSDTSAFTQQVLIDEVLYVVALRYNIRSSSWFISLTLNNGTENINNIKVVPNFPLFDIHKYQLPTLQGDFFVLKVNTDAEDEITYDNLNEDYFLVHVTESELTAWKTNNSLILG